MLICPQKQLVTLLVCCATHSAWALDGISLSGGTSLNTNSTRADFLEVSVRDSFDARGFDSSTGVLATYWEAGLARWNPQGHENWVGRLGLGARYEFKNDGNSAPYIEYSWGGAYVPDKQVSDRRQFSTHYQFVNRLEIGYRFGKTRTNELGLAYWHYSNGGTKKPNPGVDFLSLRYTRRF